MASRIEITTEAILPFQDKKIMDLIAQARILEEGISNLRDSQKRLAWPQQNALARLHESGAWLETWLIEDAGIKYQAAQSSQKN